mmetsp:Transcript_47089/g.86336  ORF Transcript_47089/g.86336 Transcript_47089/m.86336 type:complete len:1006 (-) Transcript_47089:112-3129(-)
MPAARVTAEVSFLLLLLATVQCAIPQEAACEESQLCHASRMEPLGSLTSSIAALAPSLVQRSAPKSMKMMLKDKLDEVQEYIIENPGLLESAEVPVVTEIAPLALGASAEGAVHGQVQLATQRGHAVTGALLLSSLQKQDVLSLLSGVQGFQEGHAAAFQHLVHSSALAPASTPAPEDTAGAAAYFRPVSTTLRCIMWLTIMTLVVHTCLALSRNVDELSGRTEASKMTVVLTNAVRGAPFAPVMAMFFLAYRMYILASSGGLGEPSMLVKGCMVVATVGLTLQLVIGIASGLHRSGSKAFSNYWHAGDSYNLFPRIETVSGHNAVRIIFMVLQCLCMVCIHGGLTCIGVAFVWNAFSVTMSTAVTCTAILAALYFTVELFRWIASMRIQAAEVAGDIKGEVKTEAVVPAVPRFASQLSDNSEHLAKQLAATRAASNVVVRAPMMALLFLAARMRHLQVNPPNGEAPTLVKVAFITAVAALCLEAVVSAFIGYTGHEETGYYRSYVYSASRRLHFLQHSLAGMSFEAVGVVAISIIYHWGPNDEQALSPTMVGVLILEAVFFSVHGLMWLNAVFRDLLDINWRLFRDTLLAASVSLSFAPLLGLLYVGARVRALQITQQEGSPQWWEQVCVYLTVAAVIVQLLCCLCLPIFSGVAASVDPEGNTIYDLRPLVCAYGVTLVKYCALISLHGGVLGICIAIFSMTTENTLAERPEDFAYWSAFLATAMWGVFAVLASAILASCKVLGLAVKFALESIDTAIFGTEIEVESVKFNMCRGYVEVRKLLIMNMEGKGYQTPCLLRVDEAIVQINLWRLICSLGKVFEITDLQVEGVDLNFEKGKGLGPSNVKAMLDYMEANLPGASLAPPAQVATVADEIEGDAPPSDFSLRLGHIKLDGINAAVFLPAVGKVAQVALGNLEIDDFSNRLPTSKGVAEIVGFLVKTILRTAMENATIMSTLIKQGAAACLGGCATMCSGTPSKAKPAAAVSAPTSATEEQENAEKIVPAA